MKEQKWDDTAGAAKEYFDASAIVGDDDDAEEHHAASSCKGHVTELRRRIEERMDSKRIERQFAYELDADVDLDLDFDFVDEPAESLQ